jgi:hypothetical protein
MTDREWQQTIKKAVESESWPGLDRDLWPRMQVRMTAARPAPSHWDVLLLAAIVMLSLIFPDVLLHLLYHL